MHILLGQKLAEVIVAGINWKHMREWINFYNLCVFIRYSLANAIKWPKPIWCATMVVEHFQSVMSPPNILHGVGGLKSKRRLYKWVGLIKAEQRRQWPNVCRCFSFFPFHDSFLCSAFCQKQGGRHGRAHAPAAPNIRACRHNLTHAHTHSRAHVVLPSTAEGSNENKWQSSIPAGNQGGT